MALKKLREACQLGLYCPSHAVRVGLQKLSLYPVVIRLGEPVEIQSEKGMYLADHLHRCLLHYRRACVFASGVDLLRTIQKEIAAVVVVVGEASGPSADCPGQTCRRDGDIARSLSKRWRGVETAVQWATPT